MFKFENLKVWQKGLNYVDFVYKATEKFPKHEQFGLTSQLRRSAVSFVLNIAEGSGRTTKKEYRKFLHDSLGSLRESVTCLVIIKRRKYINEKEFELGYNLAEELSKMLSGLSNSLKD